MGHNKNHLVRMNGKKLKNKIKEIYNKEIKLKMQCANPV